MTGETRPVCVYAMAGLKRNSTKLMVVMCVGIVLALYGVYIQARSQANPSYMPTVVLATSWFYQNVGHHLMYPSHLLNAGCQMDRHPFKPSLGHMFMYRFVYPTMRYSGLMNAFINLAQLILLKVFCKSIAGTDAIIGLSGLGMATSMVCLVGSFASCKLMCISCLGIHHIVIIYLAIRRRRIIKSILCPTQNINEGASCSFGSSNNSNNSNNNRGGGGISLISVAAKHTSSCVTRRGASESHDQSRRRSNRL